MSAGLYTLDTNICSFIIQGASPALREKLQSVPIAEQAVSTITQAELLFGAAKQKNAPKLKTIVDEFLLRVAVLSWTPDAARAYADLRATLEADGRRLGGMDMLIAAHARAAGAVLVTNDQALLRLKPWIAIEDWTL